MWLIGDFAKVSFVMFEIYFRWASYLFFMVAAIKIVLYCVVFNVDLSKETVIRDGKSISNYFFKVENVHKSTFVSFFMSDSSLTLWAAVVLRATAALMSR
jgi:hypothetical protein